jgi:hypothetical protein
MEKMTGEQALAMLRKTAPQEEIKWTGLEGFASENPVTTKKALLDFLKRNQVQTQDVVLGGNKPTNIYQVKPSETVYNKYVGDLNKLNIKLSELDRDYAELSTLPIDDPNYISPAEYNRIRNDLQYEADDINEKMRNETITEMGGLGQPVRYGPGTVYEKYNTLGGEDYRETLVTLPSLPGNKVKEYQVSGPFPRTFASEAEAQKYIEQLEQAKAVVPGLEERLRNFPPSIYPVNEDPGFSSSHWQGTPNIVGHIRTQMLSANPPGANRPMKLFNVDEAQSDWGKAGRDKGFVTAEDKASFPKLVKQYDELAKQRRDLERVISSGDDASPEVVAAINQASEVNRQMMALSDKMSSIRSGGVSAAPYVTSTQNWTDLSIKKSLDQAIDSGADYFTFTPGEVQAARYDLSKQISKVQYNPDDGSLMAYDPKGKMVVNESVYDPSDLDEYVGRELGDKIRAEASSREAAIDDAYELSRDEENDGWVVSLYGEPSYDRNGDPLVFGSRGEAKDYINELKANDYGNNPVSLSGLDLRTGGEGMIDYYNNIYKKRVEKVVKDLTGKKVQWEVLPAETSEGIVPRLGFRIDDDLREAKFPTFASGGVVNKALQLTRDH